MWLVSMLLAVGTARAQAMRDLPLPQPRHISGVVLDPTGEPVAEAHIDHTNDRRQLHQTDSEGRFELDTNAPAVVIRKAGFRSELLRTQDAAEVRVTLQKLPEGWSFPNCPSTGRYYGIDGWQAAFRFPGLPGIKASRQGHDVDYGVRSYFVRTKQGRTGITHGSGPMWSFGLPEDRDVWESVHLEEVTIKAGGWVIVDARGQFANGNRWRNLGKFGESASYSAGDEVTARTLDRLLDGACLK